MKYIQLNLLEPVPHEMELFREVEGLRESQNVLRRGIFQRYDLMQKEIRMLKEEVQQIRLMRK